jgi:predicted Zn-dependent protease
MMTTIAGSMIVKNEAKADSSGVPVIARCLRSLRPHISRYANDGARCADPNKAAKRVQLLERMTQSEPANGHAWMMLGQELTNAGRLREAIAAYEGCTSVAETTRRASSHSSASRRL